MLTGTEDLVIFTSAYFIIGLVMIVLAIIGGNIFVSKGVFRFFAVLGTCVFVPLAVLFGAKFQEVLLALLILVLVQVVSDKIFGETKEEKQKKEQDEENKK
jgi:membrane protein implicated in regulation of membrane protease activity